MALLTMHRPQQAAERHVTFDVGPGPSLLQVPACSEFPCLMPVRLAARPVAELHVHHSDVFSYTADC